MTNRYIPSDVVNELLWSSDGAHFSGWEKIKTEEGDQSRWHRWQALILRDITDDSFWAVDYREGLTENQEDVYPWQGAETAEAYQVYPHEKVTVEYY